MTLIYAHRGASAFYPEHTVPAYEEALRRGADGVECDLRMTADGVAVLWHDGTVDRCSNGTGRVSKMTLAELRQLDVYHWRTDVPEVSADCTRIMTLEQLLELTTSHHALVRLAIETKHPVRTAGAIERELARLLKRFGIHEDRERVMTMSFSRRAVKRSASLLPKLSHVYLVEKQNAHVRHATVPTGATVIGPDVQFVLDDQTLVERNHAKQQQVYVWTVDDPRVAARCRTLGIDALATNRPGEV